MCKKKIDFPSCKQSNMYKANTRYATVAEDFDIFSQKAFFLVHIPTAIVY
jgi:hypothetical protein